MRSRGSRAIRGAKTEAQRRQDAIMRTDGLRGKIGHWLLMLEQFHDVRRAPNLISPNNKCTSGPNGNHWWRILLEPTLPKRPTHVECTVPRDLFPDDLLMGRLIAPLRARGFEVDDPRRHACGCATFKVWPRKLAGQ